MSHKTSANSPQARSVYNLYAIQAGPPKTREAASPSTPPAKTVDDVQTTRERFYVLDCVRLIAMLMMMQGHTIDALLAREWVIVDQFPWTTWQYIRGLTAPVFLLVSGAVHVFATKRKADGSIPRDLLLRRLRWALTLIGIGYMMTFPVTDLIDVFFIPAHSFFEFWQINILQLSGVALILMMFGFVLTRNNAALNAFSLVFGLSIILATPFVHAVDWFALIPAFMANYLTHAHGSLFPIFPFAAYLFLGVPLGRFAQKLAVPNRELRFALTAFIGGLVIVGLTNFLQNFGPNLWPQHDYWLSNPGFMFERLGWSLVFVALATGLYIATRSLQEHYAILGSKALHIYVGHLILLYGTPWHDGYAKSHYQSMTLWESLLATALVIGICIGAVYIYDYWHHNKRIWWSVTRFTAAGALMYVLLF